MRVLSLAEQAGLGALGWTPYFQAQWELGESDLELIPARVTADRPPGFNAMDALEREWICDIPGKWRFASESRADFPTVGDWVLIEPRANENAASLRTLLDRRTCLQRRAIGAKEETQIIASNVDAVLIVTSLNADLNLRRLERYLALVWNSGAEPLVVLSKSDLSEDFAEGVARVCAIAQGARVLVCSALNGQGLGEIEAILRPGMTFVVIGSSGVGKSTLVNRFMKRDVMVTNVVREQDDKGRHTTTSRHLFRSPQGSLLIDTPGMRELALWDAGDGVAAAFQDVIAIGQRCRFTDCQHRDEPGCEVNRALALGLLALERVESFRKLTRELAFQARKLDRLEAVRQKKHWKKITKANRARQKMRDR